MPGYNPLKWPKELGTDNGRSLRLHFNHSEMSDLKKKKQKKIMKEKVRNNEISWARGTRNHKLHQKKKKIKQSVTHVNRMLKESKSDSKW